MELLAGLKKLGTSFRSQQINEYSGRDLLNLSQQSVRSIEGLVNGENLLNRRQCVDLSTKLAKTVHNTQELVVQSAASIDLFRPALENLYRSLEKAKLLVSKCCKVDWITESIFQIGNEKDFQVILFDVELCYHAIYEEARGRSQASNFQHEDLRESPIFGHAAISDVHKDQEELKKRLEDVNNQQHSLEESLRDSLDLEQRLARYLLLKWECISQQTQSNGLLISSAIMWKKENEAIGTWGHDSYLGSGASGGVLGSRWMGIPCAKKIFHADVNESLFLKEAGISLNLNHPNVIKFFCCGNEQERSECFIAMELMDMSVAALIRLQGKEKMPFSFLGAFDIIVQIARGMGYLHAMGVAHRDLKPQNVVVDKPISPHQYCVKLVDFGMSKTKVKASKSNTMSAFGIGTSRYRAPELHRNAHPEGGTGKTKWFKADVYSFAMTCVHILSLQEPFEKIALGTLHEKLMNGLRPKISDTWPEKLGELLNDCWATDSSSRPSFLEICAMLEEVRHDLLRRSSSPNSTSYQYIRMKMVENAAVQKEQVASSDDEGMVEENATTHGEQIAATGDEVRASELNDLQVDDIIEKDPLESMDGIDNNGPSPGEKLIETLQQSPVIAENEGDHVTAEQRHQNRQQENLDSLLQYVKQNVGFNNDRPIAACILYKSLLQWRSFEAERTHVFDRIIRTIDTAVDNQENNDVLAYWLSNTSTLLFLLLRTVRKASGTTGYAPLRRRSNSVTVMGRMTQGYQEFRASNPPRAVSVGSSMGGLGTLLPLPVEAKNPTLHFKLQLTAHVEKIYKLVLDNLKKEVTPLLGLCVQVPRASTASPAEVSGLPSSNVSAQQTLSCHWDSLISSLSALLSAMRENHVTPFLVRKLFTQIFSFINVQLFNSLLQRRECCSLSNGEYLLAGVAELEHWIREAGLEYAGASWEELKHIRQAVGFLVIRDKPRKSFDEITNQYCPALSVQQLYHISIMYWGDKYGNHGVSPGVIALMKFQMSEKKDSVKNRLFLGHSGHFLDRNKKGVWHERSKTAMNQQELKSPCSNSFLLEDDSSIPFCVDDVSNLMPEFDLDAVLSPSVLEGEPAFYFLMPLDRIRSLPVSSLGSTFEVNGP